MDIAALRDISSWYREYNPAGTLILAEGTKAHKYGHAHSFLACVENAKIVGSGSLVVADKLVVHGLSTGNYRENIEMQLMKYATAHGCEFPDGGYLDGEYILCWGVPNFGHWLITHVQRLTQLWHEPELTNLKLLIPEGIPRRFLNLLEIMDLDWEVAPDGVAVRKLWVPAVLTYRGHYEDKLAYIHPESVHWLRHLILDEMMFKRQPPTRLYLSRNRVAWRNLENEAVLVALLEEHGIRREYLEDYSMAQQLDMISRAELIVSHVGGASPITMFAPMTCRIVELTIPQFAGTFASRCWAHILGQPFHRIDCAPTRQTGPLGTDWDAVVPLDQVKALL